MLDDHGLGELGVDLRRGHQVGDALPIVAEVEEDAVVAELEHRIHERDLAIELVVQRDRRVDRDRRRPDAALGAVEGDQLAHRRPAALSAALRRPEPRQQAAHAREELGLVERLDEVVVGAGTQAPDLLLDLLLGGEHDDRHVAAAALLVPDPLGDGVAIELGQPDIQQDQGRLLRGPELERLLAIARDRDRVAGLLERVLQEALDVRFVVDDQDLAHALSPTTRRNRVRRRPCLG